MGNTFGKKDTNPKIIVGFLNLQSKNRNSDNVIIDYHEFIAVWAQHLSIIKIVSHKVLIY